MEFRHIFLVIAILTTAIFGMPSVYSLFSGQHNWYDTGLSDDPLDQYSIPCQKCHADVQIELDSSSIHQTFRCINCHVDINSSASHVTFIAPGCLDCHETGRQVIDSEGNTFVAPIADVFGENVTNSEVHFPLLEAANSTQLHKGENEACIACHTRKSLRISWLFFDTYRFSANRLSSSSWNVLNFGKDSESGNTPTIQADESSGKHSWTLKSQLKYRCEKCHSNIREELNISNHHTDFGCFSCHQLNPTFHAASIPSCLDCHSDPPELVTDLNGNTFIAPIAPIFSGSMNGPEVHIPFVQGAANSSVSIEKNEACASCHTNFNNNITFTRPEFIEYDIKNVAGDWVIQNLVIGPAKETIITKNFDGKEHNFFNVNSISCVACHQDIQQAVSNGGHAFEQWGRKHDPADYNNINEYCKGCHQPVTEDDSGNSPFPAYPFNQEIHAAMKIACLDCHTKPDTFYALIRGGMRRPPWDSGKMHNIQNSINQQPAYVRSYFCIACKNLDNPDLRDPNDLFHFKIYTEPQVIIYVDGQQRYP